MDRTVSRRVFAALLLAVLLTGTLWPATGGQAALPNLSDEPCGDPGDGVLRPADLSTSGSDAAAAVSRTPTRPLPATFVLVPCLAPAGYPWQLTFRVFRIERTPGDQARNGSPEPATAPSRSLGRWHRAP